MKRFPLIYPISALLLIVLISACSKSGSNPTPQNNPKVTITSLSATSGPYNTLIIIKGSGFSTALNGNQVFFNGKAAEVYTGTDSEIDAYVPLAAGTGKVTAIVNGVTAIGPIFTYQPSLVVSTFAGDKFQGGYTDGIGTAARFSEITGIVADKNGNIYVSDGTNFVIRKVTPQGVVSTLAGTGKNGTADGPAASASFDNLAGVAVDQAGNVFVIDMGNELIREITTDGNVITIAGGGVAHKYNGFNVVASFDIPMGVAVDGNGNLYVANTGYHDIVEIAANGIVTTVAGNYTNVGLSDGVGTAASFTTPSDIIVGSDGNLYVIDSYQGAVRKITVPGFAVSKIGTSSYIQPEGLAMDASGNLYVASTLSKTIVKTTPGGTSTTIAGSNETAVATDGVVGTASFVFPTGVAVDSAGNIFVADGTAIREISVQ